MWNQVVSRTSVMAVIGMLLLSSSALGQADYREYFENVGPVNPGQQGPSNLISAGWIFRNQSDPIDGVAWYPGDGFGGQPFEGAGYLASSSTATDWFGGAMSCWSVLPAVPGQQAGDVFSIWIFGGGSPTNDTFFDVRYSPSGGTSTGSTATDVGDFSQVLYSTELPLSAGGYQQVRVTVPGAGRIAMRFHSAFIMTAFGRGAFFALDSLTVGPDPAGPCGITIPQPGQTVTWTAADGPYVVCQDLVIPDGGTVIVEPGTVITFEAQDTLQVLGRMVANGDATHPIVFNGATGINAGLQIAGDVEVSFADLGVRAAMLLGGKFIFTDSTAGPGATIDGVGELVVVERCVFDGGFLGDFGGVAASVRLTNTDFINGASATLSGLVHIDNVTIDGQPLTIERETVAQPTVIENVSVTGYVGGAGLRLRGSNYLLSNVTTQGNGYPLEFFLTGGGLLPGSALPATGNQNNYIPAGELLVGQNRHWANVGIPYVIEGFPQNHGGSLTIAPGTVVKGMPGAGAFIVGSAQLNLQGTKEEPIRLEPFVGSWFGLKWVDDFNARVRGTIFSGCEIALQSDGGRMYMDDCTVQNCQTGPTSVTGGDIFMRNSRILNNAIGMTTTTTGHLDAESVISPNIFEGNTVAVDYNNTSSAPEMDQNWWNDPSGPTTPENPGGTGDVVEGLFWAWFSPWLSARPSQTDESPRVEITPIYWTAQVGDKIILRWKASDDSSIIAQRIEFAQHGFTFNTLASLPPEAHTYEFTAPLIPPTNLLEPAAIRVVVTDDIGQETWDEVQLAIPYQEDWNPTPQTITITPPNPAPGERADVCWSPTGFGDAWIVLDGDDLIRSAGGTTAGCLPIGVGAPWVSTDTARAVVRTTFGAGGRYAFWFSDYFTIRPDPRYGDAAPDVTVTSPAGGESYRGGGVIPVRWTASDDEGVRSINIQASYDGGRTWHYVEKDLSGSTTAFDWRLPPSAGIADVQVRIVAIDYRFQSTSDTSGSFEILAGEGGIPGDLDGDGDVDLTDLAIMLSAFGACSGDAAYNPDADLNNDGCIALDDLAVLLANYGT